MEENVTSVVIRLTEKWQFDKKILLILKIIPVVYQALPADLCYNEIGYMQQIWRQSILWRVVIGFMTAHS
ncbi:hypothetical protein CPZ13_10715 [Lacticaseibacillus paracasei]|nr:hypothetical protein [Lacticaseibacillus paracasei]PCL22667.1 hypothetical protein CPZ14_11130 [Lacticaseibacillus paracasei]PCL33470.1 hypothetical protein CPZ13_10715 [Lacticaseibacillus paracasei]